MWPLLLNDLVLFKQVDGKHKRRDSIFERLQVDIQHLCLSKFLLGLCHSEIEVYFKISNTGVPISLYVAHLNIVGFEDYSRWLLGHVDAVCIHIYTHRHV